MPQGAPPAPRPPLWRRRLVRLALLAAVLGAVLYAARDRLLWTPLVRGGAAWLERETGLAADFAQLEAEGLRRIELVDFALRDRRDGDPRLGATLDRLEVTIRPWALARGDLRGLLAVEATGGSIEVDLGAFASEESAGEPLRPADIPPLALHAVDLRLDLAGDGKTIEARGVSARLAAEGDDRSIDLTVGELVASLPDAPTWRGLAARGRWSADELALTEFGVGEQRRELELRLPTGEDGAPVAAQLRVALAGGTLHARSDLGPTGSRTVEFELELEDLPAALAQDRRWLEGLLQRPLALPPSAGELSGTLSIDGAVDTDALRFVGTVGVEQLAHPALPGLPLDLRTAVDADAGAVVLTGLSANLARTGGTLVAPRIELDPTRATTLGWIAGAGGTATLNLPPSSPAWPLILGADALYPRVDVQLSTRGGAAGVAIDSLRARAPGAAFDLLAGELELVEDGSGPAWRYAVDGELTVSDSKALLAAAGWPDSLPGQGRARVSMAGRGTDLDAVVDSEFDALDLTPLLPGAPPLDSGSVLVRVTSPDPDAWSVAVEQLSFSAADDLLTASAGLRVPRDSPGAATLETLDAWGRVADAARWSADAPGIAFEFSLGGDGPLAAPELRAGLGWRLVERPEVLSGDAIVRWAEGVLQIEQAGLLVDRVSLDGSGSLEPLEGGGLDANLRELTVQTDGGDLVLSAPVRIARAADGPVEVQPFQLVGSAGAARVERSLAGDWALDLRGVPAGALATPWMPPGMDLGELSGHVEMNGSGAGQSIRGSIELLQPTWALDLPGRGGTAETAVAQARAAVLDVALERSAELAFAGECTVEVSDLTTRGVWPGAVDFAPGSARAGLVLGADGVVQVELDVQPDPRTGFELAGTLALPGPLEAWPGGEIAEASTVALSGSAQLASLSPLAGRLSSVRAIEGRIDLDRIAVSGSLADPDLAVDGRLSQGFLRLDAELPPIRGLTGPIAVSGRTLELRELSGEAGAAPLRLGGSIELGPDPALDLTLVGDNLLLARRPDLNVRGDVKLALSGPLSRALLAGDVALRNSRYTRDVDFFGLRSDRSRPGAGRGGLRLFSLRESPFDALRFDVTISSTPGDPFAIETNVVRGSLRPDLRLIGTGEVPELRGPIFVDPTRVSLPSTTLRTTGGAITFDPADPYVPRLDLRAETRMRGYDLSLVVSGSYDDPDLLVTTVPPLSDKDSLLLLATGQPPESVVSANGGVQTAQMLAVFLAQDIGNQFFGGSSEGRDGLMDRFEAFVGRDVSKGGLETVEVQFRIAEDWLVEGDRVFLTGERDVYEDVNGGVRLLFRFR